MPRPSGTREGLAQAGMVEALFQQFDGYLARQGYIARGGQILDVSIVPVPKGYHHRSRSRKERVAGAWRFGGRLRPVPKEAATVAVYPFRSQSRTEPIDHSKHHLYPIKQ